MITLIEIIISGGNSVVMGNRNDKSDKKDNILYKDAHKFYNCSTMVSLPYIDFQFSTQINLVEIINTPHDFEVRNFIEVDLI